MWLCVGTKQPITHFSLFKKNMFFIETFNILMWLGKNTLFIKIENHWYSGKSKKYEMCVLATFERILIHN